jgi:hypothetical protein
MWLPSGLISFSEDARTTTAHSNISLPQHMYHRHACRKQQTKLKVKVLAVLASFGGPKGVACAQPLSHLQRYVHLATLCLSAFSVHLGPHVLFFSILLSSPSL